MIAIRASILLLLLLALGLPGVALSADAGCTGKFANPVTDICWSCAFPMSIAGKPMKAFGQEDTDNPDNAVCACEHPLMVGVTVGYWEPVRLVDVTRTPYCMVSLGGVSLNPGFHAPRGGPAQMDGETHTSFYQVHWYTNPVLHWLGVILDFPCLEKGTLDIAYLTEVDPLWNDDELSAIINPDALLFGNPVTVAACTADCVAATAGFPLSSLFWCGGCQGNLYPLDGHVSAHVGAVQATSLLTERMAAKMHRQGLAFSGYGSAGQCGMYYQPIMDKSQYKYQMTYPVPQTSKINGRCCQPFGRSTVLWGSGKSFPVSGEDFAYQIFRKRTCCASNN
jgi:conjugal transfer pilus assembly protein TraU